MLKQLTSKLFNCYQVYKVTSKDEDNVLDDEVLGHLGHILVVPQEDDKEVADNWKNK